MHATYMNKQGLQISLQHSKQPSIFLERARRVRAHSVISCRKKQRNFRLWLVRFTLNPYGLIEIK